jgi:hypothetical protein
MDFSAIVLWIVKNDPFAFLSLTKIRNIFKNPKFVNFVKKSVISKVRIFMIKKPNPISL